MCLECSFYSFSTDTGCTVELVSSGNSSIEHYTETINRSGNGIAKGCVYGITRGQYDISVYDQSSRMLFRTLVGINVTEQTTTTSITTFRAISSATTSSRGTRASTTSSTGKYNICVLVLTQF